MTRLRLQFVLFFFLLFGTASFFLWNSYRQVAREERELWRSSAEKVYNQMQAAVSDFLTREDARKVEEYHGVGPLSEPPIGDPKGLLGYFEMNTEGTLSIPSLPRTEGPEKERRQKQLEDLTLSLRKEVSGHPPRPASSVSKGFVELGSLAAEPQRPPAPGQSGSMAQNIYPNPVQEQAVRLEEKKRALAPSPPTEPAALFGAVSVSTNPFQARLIDQRFLVFYRHVWADGTERLQGFAVALERFFAWLMEQSFANSDLPEFAAARLELDAQPVAKYGVVEITNRSPFFERPLGYPLNLLVWRVYADRLPHLSNRLWLHALSALLIVLVTAGLFTIYRSASAQVVLSQMRQDFVSAVTHELKTPLTSIRMYSEMLEDGWAADEEKKRDYYRQISRESGRLTRLVENVLQLARLEKKTFRLSLKTQDPTADLNEIGEDLRKIAEAGHFEWALRLTPPLPPVRYDPEALKQILLALLDNSLKFGAEAANRLLELGAAQEGGRLVLFFRDRGPGVPEGELKKVFNNFYRVENERTRKTKGTGIGLAMCRMLAEAMGVSIAAANRSGGGLEIRLEFP